MRLKEFVEKAKSELDQFQSDYEAKLASPPEGQVWHEEMSEGDWYDEFLEFEARR